jgi:hypothetical protein
VRKNCVFISTEGRLYQYDGSKLAAVGMTEAQAQQLALLVPQEVASETKLAEMESAGLNRAWGKYIIYLKRNDNYRQ